MTGSGHGETNSPQSFLVRSIFNTGRLAAPQYPLASCQEQTIRASGEDDMIRACAAFGEYASFQSRRVAGCRNIALGGGCYRL
jgi:hypothetical protein